MRNSIMGLVILCSSTAGALADTSKEPTRAPASLEVSSTAFANNTPIPAELTCDGAGTAPPLSWSKVPAGTRSIAILVDDPDAPKGTFTHWLVTGISPTISSIGGALPEGAIAAKNDKGTTGYTAPCPPSGEHHYRFRVYALNIPLAKAMTRAELVHNTRGHVLATGVLTGTYRREAGR